MGIGNSIVDRFPYPSPRKGQREILESLETNWDNYDVFVCICPTSFGKTAIMKTIMNWKYSVSATTPNNLLVDQFIQEFPNTPTLRRLDSYKCEEWDRPCSVTRGKLRNFCSVRRGCSVDCIASADLARAKYRRGPGIYNYHIHMAHKLYREVVCVDECHNAERIIQDQLAIIIWQHDYKYPHNMYKHEHIRKWIESLSQQKKAHKKIQLLNETVSSSRPYYVVIRTTEEFNGKGTKRGEPELRDCLKLFPVDISNAPQYLWSGLGYGGDTKKLVLLSATVNAVDIAELGLSNKRVLYLHASSPIPAKQRPVVLLNTASLSYNDLQLDKVVTELEGIMDYHSNEKGVIHVTYQIAQRIRDKFTKSSARRLLFHTAEDKRDIYQSFRNSRDPVVLVACGMYEGIDLPDDLGRWQAIAKCPWKSLGDPAISYKAKENVDWYNWSTLRDLIQACGRICRHEKDYGISYILDSTTNRLLNDGKHLIPQWFHEALEAGKQLT